MPTISYEVDCDSLPSYSRTPIGSWQPWHPEGHCGPVGFALSKDFEVLRLNPPSDRVRDVQKYYTEEVCIKLDLRGRLPHHSGPYSLSDLTEAVFSIRIQEGHHLVLQEGPHKPLRLGARGTPHSCLLCWHWIPGTWSIHSARGPGTVHLQEHLSVVIYLYKNSKYGCALEMPPIHQNRINTIINTKQLCTGLAPTHVQVLVCYYKGIRATSLFIGC